MESSRSFRDKTYSNEKIHRKPYTWWQNKEDIMKFLEVAQGDPYELAYRLGLECGMRLGEIVGLCKDAIDLENCHIHIHRQWIEKDRIYGPPKHGKNRYIRFEQGSILHRLLKESLSINLLEQRLFLSQGGSIVSSKKLSQVYFQRLIAKSGVPKIRFHDLRHTFASWYMKAGGSIWELKGILGHADIQIKKRIHPKQRAFGLFVFKEMRNNQKEIRPDSLEIHSKKRTFY